MQLFDQKPIGTSEAAKLRTVALANSMAAGFMQRIALFASCEIGEPLTASMEVEFIPYGEPDPALLAGIQTLGIDGVLVHFESGKSKTLDFMDAAARTVPDLPCLILCNLNDQRDVVRYCSQVIAARDLASVPEIEEKLQRALFLFPWMRCDVLRRILATLKTIPSEAASHQRIVKLLQDPQFSLEQVSKLIQHDPALTAHLLKIVNSVAFFRGSPVSSVDEAVTMLGASKLQALIASAWAFFVMNEKACPGFHPKNEWQHAGDIADRVRKLCEAENVESSLTETAIVAALLHDLGKLLLAANQPQQYATILAKAEQEKCPFWQMENQMLGFNHAEVAGCLLALWGVPLPVAQAVLLHHCDGLSAKSPASLIQRAHAQ